MSTPPFDTPWRPIAADERAVIERVLDLCGETTDAQSAQLDVCKVRSCTICGGACGGFEFAADEPVEVGPGGGPLGADWSAAEGWVVNFLLWTSDRRLTSLEVLCYGEEASVRVLPRWPTREELSEMR